MSSVIVSHVPTSVTAAKLQEFFAFCGSIKSVNELGADGTGHSKYQVNFVLEKALSTAVLLNEAELDGVPISVVTESLLPSYDEVPKKEAGAIASGAVQDDNKVQDSVHTGDENYDDISQEEKPKLAILAQLLALGYKLSDDLIAKAVKVDKKQGCSSKFKSFLNNLDTKYLHTQDPESSASKNINKAQTQFNSFSTQLQNSSYTQKLQHYFDRASASPYGAKVHKFYKQVANEVTDVHNEATRLYNLKKSESSTVPSTTVAGTTASETVPGTAAPVADTKVDTYTEKN